MSISDKLFFFPDSGFALFVLLPQFSGVDSRITVEEPLLFLYSKMFR